MGQGLGTGGLKTVDVGSPYREVKDRLEVYLGVPLLRGRMAGAPTGCGQGGEPLKV